MCLQNKVLSDEVRKIPQKSFLQFGNKEDQESIQKNLCLQLMSPYIFQGLPVPGSVAICKDSLHLKGPGVVVMAPSPWSPPFLSLLLDQTLPGKLGEGGKQRRDSPSQRGCGRASTDVSLASPSLQK